MGTPIYGRCMRKAVSMSDWRSGVGRPIQLSVRLTLAPRMVENRIRGLQLRILGLGLQHWPPILLAAEKLAPSEVVTTGMPVGF